MTYSRASSSSSDLDLVDLRRALGDRTQAEVAELLAKAKPITISIGNSQLDADPKEFSSGSLGWYAGGKMIVEVEGVRVSVQVGLNLTIVGSKELPDDPGHPHKAMAEAASPNA